MKLSEGAELKIKKVKPEGKNEMSFADFFKRQQQINLIAKLALFAQTYQRHESETRINTFFKFIFAFFFDKQMN